MRLNQWALILSFVTVELISPNASIAAQSAKDDKVVKDGAVVSLQYTLSGEDGKTINFAGLPEIFIWYNGGIGLSPKAEIDATWIDCFYNRHEAEKGYDILHKLMVNYEFDWPKGAPAWTYRTHSVLEQMYHKLGER